MDIQDLYEHGPIFILLIIVLRFGWDYIRSKEDKRDEQLAGAILKYEEELKGQIETLKEANQYYREACKEKDARYDLMAKQKDDEIQALKEELSSVKIRLLVLESKT